jgi:hypothetical protein
VTARRTPPPPPAKPEAPKGPRIRCEKCGALLVALEDYEPGAVQGYGELPRVHACPKCDGPLKCVNVLRGLYRRAGDGGGT